MKLTGAEGTESPIKGFDKKAQGQIFGDDKDRIKCLKALEESEK